MQDLARRYPHNPILRPADVIPSAVDLEVRCLLNPGVFEYEGRIGLLVRVAEWPRPAEGEITSCVRDPDAPDGIRRIRLRHDDPRIIKTDPRLFSFEGKPLLTTLSHLRLAWSTDGERFEVEPRPTLVGQGPLETYGIEDCRITHMEDRYWLTFTAVSEAGVGVALASTADWRNFTRHGLIISPHNKDCALFPQRFEHRYVALHRPSGHGLGGHYMWIATSPDLLHWGDHRCLAMTRPNSWDSQRIGANGPPIRTPRGWLILYHGANQQDRYCLGAMLTDLDDPSRLIARSREPIMQPLADYEQSGFLGHVVFNNGHLVRGQELILYYGASDEVICRATLRLDEILNSLEPC
jgi:predicted GH43/DUF377 family glycosyl hydrolase